jgi:hypothetical protein
VSADLKWIDSVVCELSVDPPSDFRCNSTTNATIISPALTNATLTNATIISPALTNATLTNEMIISPALTNATLTNATIISPALTNATLTVMPASTVGIFKSSVPPRLAIFLLAGAALLVFGRAMKRIFQNQVEKEERMKLVKAPQLTYESI